MIRQISPLLLAGIAAIATASPVVGQSLRGSRASVDLMYTHAKNENVRFYSSAANVTRAARSGELVQLRSTANYSLHQVRYPYVMEETKLFLDRLGAQYRAACGEKLVVTGAMRPSYWKLANASDRSVHPTGMALDLRRPSGRCLTWLRKTLLTLEGQGVIEATEENRPPHFHVAVFPRPYAHYVATGATPGASVATRVYAIRRGDSLWSIAQRHETTVQELRSMNALRSSTIRVGQTLLVPATVR
jgi:hypothetical protein